MVGMPEIVSAPEMSQEAVIEKYEILAATSASPQYITYIV